MKKLISLCLSLFLAVNAAAPMTAHAGKIATEYYSADLTDNLSATADSDSVLPASAKPMVDAKAAVLMERDSGQVLYEMNAHEKRAPASITKVMSLLLVMEAIDSGKLTLKSKISASEHACSMGGSQIWLEPGETMTVDELLRAAVIASANDATVALAEAVAGSEEAFVDKMNTKAKALSMNDTHFENASGLDAKGHVSSAYDIAVMSTELLKHSLIKKYTGVWMDSLRNGQSQLVNTNKLVRFYEGTTGLKTGTTSTAGFCVSATAEKNGMELCAVILGAQNNDGRFSGAKKLLNYGFANWTLKTVTVPKKDLVPVKVQKGCNTMLTVTAAGSGKYLLGSGTEESPTVKVSLPDTVVAPIVKGQKIGTAAVYIGKKQIGSIDLLAAQSVERLDFRHALHRVITALCTL